MDTVDPYGYLRHTLSRPAWERIGTARRSGVVAPLFSIYSGKSCGIGEVTDLSLLVDWCRATGISIIQLLPMNDVGYNFRPYDSQSMFALEPMYLSPDNLSGIDVKAFEPDIERLRKKFPLSDRVNYDIKGAKLELFSKIFAADPAPASMSFRQFVDSQSYWVLDYALFKVIKDVQKEESWEVWPEPLKHRRPEALREIEKTYQSGLSFHMWLQWQLFEQMSRAKEYAASRGVFLMGDLPFLVSRDSADVWAHQEYFKMDLASGAPPDMLFAHGQRWGMPPYNWPNIANHRYDYIVEKLKYASHFYDMYRIDHVVGMFRVWTIPTSEPQEQGGLNGRFDPFDEPLWEEHGRNLLSVMIKNSPMLACAEDLGTIPPCTFRVLEELGVPGIDIQRWMKEWGGTYGFKDPSLYRKTAMATLGTHDMSSLSAWWLFEAGTVDEGMWLRKCRERGLPFEQLKERLFDIPHSRYGRLRWRSDITSPQRFLSILGLDETQAKDLVDLYRGSFDEKKHFQDFLGLAQESASTMLVKKALQKVLASASIFSCQLLFDWLSLDALFDADPWETRINFPGTLSSRNWTLTIGIPLEDMLELPVNTLIHDLTHRKI